MGPGDGGATHVGSEGGVAQGPIVVDPTDGLFTTEMGGTATFTIVLKTKPTANVTVGLSSSNVKEGTVAPASVTFTPANYNAPQTVTVTGVDDSLPDGNQPYKIITAPATSTDPTYNGVDPLDVNVTNIDDETAGITVVPTVGLITNESGGDATFTVVLNSAPKANVIVPLASTDTKEGTVSPASLTFTKDNWKAPQVVTVTGVDDAIADGNKAYKITVGPATSTDPSYNGAKGSDVDVTNEDNDIPGFTVKPTAGLMTNEDGQMATFTVALNLKPTANVVIGLSSSNTNEGTVSPASLTFTPQNWNAPQIVTVTGVDDSVADGNQIYTIITAPAVSDDAGYNHLDPPDVQVVNVDNDSPGITAKPQTGLTTSEAGMSATFTLVLNSKPTGDVALNLTSSAPTEGTVSPKKVTFTSTNWNAPQTITINGVDDATQDGNQPYTIHVTVDPTSADMAYVKLAGIDVSATNLDNDTAGIVVQPTMGLVTTEKGGSATFTIVLQSKPVANVTVGLTSSNTAEGTVSPASLVFTPANYNAPQTVTVKGVDDAVADGNQAYKIVTAAATSADPLYNGINPPDVSVTNTDDDSAGITVKAATPLTTTEAGGQATFTIVLNSQPKANVSIALSSSKTSEGTVSPASVTFTAANWNAPQTITVTGVDDAVADGNQPYTIVTAPAVSADPGYNGIDTLDIQAINVDNDSAGITVNPTSGLVTTEAGGQATFTVVLNSQPTASVSIGITSSRTTEGTVSPASLTFTTVNWKSPQTVTVTGVDDAVADGNQLYTIVTAPATSGDPNYNNRDAPDVSVTNTDNDSAGITVTPTSGLVTTEAGGQATFTIVLNSQPTANVTIGITSSNTKEGTVSPASVTFTPANYKSPQTITVTGVDDAVQDGNQPYTIVLAPATSADPGYNTRNAPDVSVTNTDNDSAGITVMPTSGLVTTEAGGQATFTIVLTSQPTAPVTIALSSNDTTEGTVSPVSVTFTPANYKSPQTVTITGVDDAVADGNQPYKIITAQAASNDPNYSAINPPDVDVTNTDNDSAGITVMPTSGLVTTEAGGQATFTIVLTSQPTANVTIGLTSNNTAEGTVSPASVTFTPANYKSPQTVTITGVDDAVQDGNQPYKIITAQATSGDPNYAAINPPDVNVTNTDNDSAGITVTPTSGLTTTENPSAAGHTATFTIVLNSQPTANVTIGLHSDTPTEGTVSPGSVTFTAVNWKSPQTVTVTGVDDAVQDGNQPYKIITDQAMSADPNYSAINPPDVSLTNIDNDSAGITVMPTSGLTTTENPSAAGHTATFTIVLNSQPTANVTIGLSSSNTNEGTVSPTSVTFTASNWNAAQTVTVTGVDDNVQDGNQAYSIITAQAVSTDPNYSVINPQDVSLTNIDNDSAGITVMPTSGLTTTENPLAPNHAATFTIVLNSQPTANVTIGLSSSNTNEGTVSPASVTFTASNWNAAQTVTVTGVDDNVADGNQAYSIVTAQATSADPNYSVINPPDVSLTNIDNDSAGINVSPTSGLVTTEAAGAQHTATFTIVLNSQPTANVTIGLSSSNTNEGTVSPSSVTFTTSNWNSAQTVTVTGVDDNVADGNQAYSIVTAQATSADNNYNVINPPDVSVTNIDNDSAGFTVMPTSGLVTGEDGTQATFTIVLRSQPTGTNSVTVNLTSSNQAEGKVSPATFTFTTANWNVAKTFTLTGQDDLIADGDQPYTISITSSSGDPAYDMASIPSVSATNTDNDTPGIIVAPTTCSTTPTTTAQFTITLRSQPTSSVSIAVHSDTPTEGTVTAPTGSVVLDATNWNTGVPVTVTGLTDGSPPGTMVMYNIITDPATSADGNYNNRNAVDVSCTNTQ
jgi:hypothetical protein